MPATITELANQSLECGEGPVWDPHGQRLFWTDGGGTSVFSLTEGASKPVIVNDRLSLTEFAKMYPGAVRAIDVHSSTIEDLARLIQSQVEQKDEVRKLDLDLGKYDWKNVCKTTLDLYRKIIEES